jgi:menaquinone-dependent protoporphyrinogen oxidase
MTLLNRRDFLEMAAAGLLLKPSGPVLVAYASRCGSTAEIAKAVAGDLGARGFSIELRSIDKVAAVNGYQAVVLGSAVRFGKWLPESVDFVKRNRAGLTAVPTAFFTVHLMNTGADEKSRKARMAYLDPVHAVMRPSVETFFAGKMDLARLTFAERLLGKIMKASNEDRRDWPAIHAWAGGILAPAKS